MLGLRAMHRYHQMIGCLAWLGEELDDTAAALVLTLLKAGRDTSHAISFSSYIAGMIAMAAKRMLHRTVTANER